MRYLFVLLCFALAVPVSAQSSENAFPNLTFSRPVDIQAPDDGSNRLFVVEQTGRIKVFENDPAASTTPVFLNIASRVNSSANELGLLGLVFDPGYAQNGYFYVNYTRTHPNGADPDPFQTVIARFEVTGDPNVADPNSEEILITIDQPFSNHNAGQLQFGPDGYLYVALGDGGSAGDPQNNGQTLSTLLGSLLRLDVRGSGLPLDCAAGTGSATVPADNPFAGGPGGACDEAYAYGLRNPFRFSFGPDGRLWLADVGQGRREEIDLVVAGGNYGWDDLEGTLCYPSGAPNCPLNGTIPPIYEHPHNFFSSQGAFSVIGGYVYTGPSCAALRGKYVYGDFVTRNFWTLTYDGSTADNDELSVSATVSTFGEDEQGDVYFSDLNAGRIFRFDCATDVAVTAAATVGGDVTIPAGGGSFQLDVTLANTTASAQTVDVWISADLSNGAERRAVLGPQTVTLPAGASGSGRVTLTVPGLAPSGVNTGVVQVGSFPDGPTDAARFTVTKQAGALGAAAGSAEWQAASFDFAAGSGAAAGDAPEARAESTAQVALSAFPTPFAGQTSVHYRLAEAGALRLAVFDVLGREVALLAEGRAEAGAHAAVFDARGLPSGAYVVRLEAGGTVETRTVTRLR